MQRSLRRGAWLDSLLLLFLSTVLIRPIFKLEYLDNWPSIESGFISDARTLAGHMPHPGWQPLWYCGTRFDYIDPPALRYGTVLLMKLGRVSAPRAYHFYCGLLYVLGIVAVYWLVRIATESRAAAWIASLATALVSPAFLLLANNRHDSPYWVPQRLHVMMAYGEGPHISSLSVLPAAMACALLALPKKRPIALAGAGFFCALTVANNFYGATALAVFFPILVWSIWAVHRDQAIWLRASGIVLLAYALSAFWFTPSYLRVTLANLAFVAPPGETRPRLILAAAMIVYAIVSFRWAYRKPERFWTTYVAGLIVCMSVYVAGWYYLGLNILGDAQRLVPEYDLALIFAATGLVMFLWRRRGWRVLAIVMVVAAVYPAAIYAKHYRFPFPKVRNLETQYDFQVTKWVNDHLPGERVVPIGTVRFWFDAWSDLTQEDGAHQEGELNPVLRAAEYQITAGDRGDLAILWMQALGADAVIVPDETSPEYYHDFAHPYKFRGLAPVLNDDGRGTVIYRIPRIFPSIARVVDQSEMAAFNTFRAGNDDAALKRYVAAIENPRQAQSTVAWKSFDEAALHAETKAGESILFQETYDPAWHAYENGRAIPIRQEPAMDFMLIDAPAGAHDIDLRFETPTENKIGWVILALGLAAIGWLVWRDVTMKRERDINPAGENG